MVTLLLTYFSSPLLSGIQQSSPLFSSYQYNHCRFLNFSVPFIYVERAITLYCSESSKKSWLFGKKFGKRYYGYRGFPGGTSGKEPTCHCWRHEMRVRSLGQEDPLEEGRATHSGIFAWRIPRTEETGGQQSIGLQRVGHNWSDVALTHTITDTFWRQCAALYDKYRHLLSWLCLNFLWFSHMLLKSQHIISY